MIGNTQDDMPPSSLGKEKRAFTRNSVFLEGECTIPHQPACAINILDFCPGGVFLTFPMPPVSTPVRGHIIEIRCSVPTSKGVQTLRFQGRVARADHEGAGIAFINPNFEALHVLHEYAQNIPVEQLHGADKKPDTPAISDKAEASTEFLLRSCSQIVEERIEPIAKEFLEQVSEYFFNQAGEVHSIAEKNACYSASNIFTQDGATFTREFLSRIQTRLRQTPLLVSETKKSPQISGGGGELSLSLVEDDAFENWLSFTDMAHAAELEHKEELYALDRRLSALFKQPVNKENNPFGPGTISQIFQEALGTLALERKIASGSCKVFKNVLCKQAGELYAALNQHLVDGGVLPVLHHADKPSFKPVHAARNSAAELNLQSETAPQVHPELAHEESITGLTAPPFRSTDAATSFGNPLPLASQPSTAMPPIPSEGHAPQGTTPFSGAEQQMATPAVTSQSLPDWYQLIQGLGQLQQQLSAQAGYPGGQQSPFQAASPGQMQHPFQAASSGQVAGTPGTPSGHAEMTAHQEQPAEPRHFTTDEVLSALSRIRLETPGTQPGENFHQGLMHKLQTELAETAPSAEIRQVPSRETNILEIGGNLFNSVLTDRLVAETVKPWLNQLSIPLIKMSLRDDSLFYDKSHLARQLINQIAELELFGSVSKVENAVRRKIDGLLSEISEADEVTPDVLQKMLKEVSLLVHVQNKAYEGNLRDLRTMCEAEEQREKTEKPGGVTSALSKLFAGLGPSEKAPEEEDEALKEYRKRVRRLKVGNWLLLQREGLQKRIRLAWVAKNLDKYVFVNVQGLREETLSQKELAQYLRSGDAVVLDEGDEQLVDRAQSSMLQQMHQKLLHESSHDQLTGFINRREFEKRLEITLAGVRDSGMPSILCFLDLEQFNIVNNTFGYEEGDRALLEIAKLLKQEMGEDGLLARIGGDEFAMLIENCSLDDALRMTSSMTSAFRAYRFVSGEKTLSLSFSAGLVEIDPESESIEKLLQAAEASCRIARSKGTNYVQVYHPDETNLARHLNAVKWVSRIDDALDKGRLELRCQPIVSINGNRVSVHHSEVLLGVPDEQGNLMSPVDFIMAAEHFRRMSNVDRWVVEHAFLWMVDRRNKLAELGGLAINLSGASLNEEGFIDFVLGKADELKVPMNMVCFEITETAGISHLSGATEFISELKRLTGCTFSLDDFGSGLSSYAYLKNLPVDYLKIDGAFVEKMDQNPYDFAVVKSITEIGHFMGKKIIAERVENEAVLKMLRQIGVDYGQGFYLGKLRNMKTLGS